MNDKYFLDTNIIIYSIGNIIPKKKVSVDLIGNNAVISTQIITESANVMHRKLKYGYSDIRAITEKFVQEMNLSIITHHTINNAFNISERYGYSYYDSQVIASALESDSPVLYSEDLQHNQIIEHRLRIINPFHIISLWDLTALRSV
jgi:predicted nucleic acid-binding protein